jgi:hypothetical protein
MVAVTVARCPDGVTLADMTPWLATTGNGVIQRRRVLRDA